METPVGRIPALLENKESLEAHEDHRLHLLALKEELGDSLTVEERKEITKQLATIRDRKRKKKIKTLSPETQQRFTKRQAGYLSKHRQNKKEKALMASQNSNATPQPGAMGQFGTTPLRTTRTPWTPGASSAASASSAAGYTTESSMDSEGPPPPVETPLYMALNYGARFGQMLLTDLDVPATPNMRLFQERWNMKRQMRADHAKQILQVQSQADAAVKDNRDKALAGITEIHQREEEEFEASFPAIGPPEVRRLLYDDKKALDTIQEDGTGKPDSKPAARNTSTAKTKKRKAVSSRGPSKKKVKELIKKSQDLVFAFKTPGVYTTNSILFMDERLPDQKWDFDHLLRMIADLNCALKEEDGKERKYRIVGHRNKEVVAPSDIGIQPASNDHSGSHIPYVTVHALLDGEIERVVDTVESKSQTSFRFCDIGHGKTYEWVPVGLDDLDVKMLKYRKRDSSRAACCMSEEDRAFFTSAHVWLPKSYDINNANPFRAVSLEFEETELVEPSQDEKDRAKQQEQPLQRAKGDNAIFVDDNCFKAARKVFLKERLQARLHQDPNFCSEVEESKRLREQKKIIWNEILLDVNEESWIESMLAISEKLMDVDEFKDELEAVTLPKDDVLARLQEVARKALADFHPRMLEELEQYTQMKSIVEGAKHFKIYPNNEVLHYSFLHRDNHHINEMLGKAEKVFPTPTKAIQTPPLWSDSPKDDAEEKDNGDSKLTGGNSESLT